MEKLQHQLWIVQAVNQLLGPLVRSGLEALGFHPVPGANVIPDYLVMNLVGLPCCPADAVSEIKQISKYISPVKGGEGCARDVIEKVMKLRDHWNEDLSIRSR